MRRFLSQVRPSNVKSVVDGLKKLYFERLRPLEETYHFNEIVSPFLTESEFYAKPIVMVLGQYSTGKTSFIKHLLKREYPGAYIGPEPTTDRFVTVMEGNEERVIPGNAAVVQADMPFSGLSRFGSSFLSKFECSQMPNPVSPRHSQAKIFLQSKLDEFKEVINSLHGHDSKIRLLLNKADGVNTQQLMRVYGALMWSLGKVIQTPEVMRVYIGSFSDQPLSEKVSGDFGRELFQREQEELLADLRSIPKKSLDRRVNEFVKRAQAAKVHAFIIGHLKSQMPYVYGKSKKQHELLQSLKQEFFKVQTKHHIPHGDFPNVERFRNTLTTYNIDKFPKLKPKLIQDVDDMLAYDIPNLLREFEPANNVSLSPVLQEMKGGLAYGETMN